LRTRVFAETLRDLRPGALKRPLFPPRMLRASRDFETSRDFELIGHRSIHPRRPLIPQELRNAKAESIFSNVFSNAPRVARIIDNSRDRVRSGLSRFSRASRSAARVGVGHRSASGCGGLGGEGRNGGAGQTDVSEQSERWRLIDWFVGGRIISRTRSERASALDRAHGIASVYVYPYERAIRAGRGRGRKLVM